MQLPLSFITVLLAAAAPLVQALPADTGRPDMTIDLSHRNLRPRNLARALEDVQRARAKVYTAMEHYRANFGDYPKGANRTALERYAKGLTSSSSASASASASLYAKRANAPAGTLKLTDQDNQELWTGQQYYGTPKQGPFNQDHDTGSSDTLISPGHYNPSKSSTAHNTGRSFSIMYGDGTTASGPVYTDDLYIAGLEAKNQSIGVSNSTTLASDGAVGISGMAFKSISQERANPFFYNLVEQGAVKEDIFAFGLQRKGARLDLGGLDHSAYTGTIKYAKVDSSNGFWETSGSINGADFDRAIIDTGTTVIIGPPLRIAEVCFSAGGTPVPNGLSGELLCETSGTPGDVTVTIGGGSYKLSAESLTLQQSNGKTILGLIGDAEIGLEDGAIFGDTFLQNVYAAFKGNTGSSPQVGFAATSSKA